VISLPFEWQEKREGNVEIACLAALDSNIAETIFFLFS